MYDNLRGLKASIFIWGCTFTGLLLLNSSSTTTAGIWAGQFLIGAAWLTVTIEFFKGRKRRKLAELGKEPEPETPSPPILHFHDDVEEDGASSEKPEKPFSILYTQAELNLAVMREKERWVGVLIDNWNRDPTEMSLPDYLGMGKEEYARWLARGVLG